MQYPIHSCQTKAVIADGDQLQTGIQWIASRRGRLKLFDDRLKCGNWTVPYEDIREAVLSSFRSHLLRIPGYVLSVGTDEKTYHFGLNGWRYWQGELPFPVTRQKSKLRWSFVSIAARAVLIGYIAYQLWRWFASA